MTEPTVSVPAELIPRLKKLWASGLSAVECGAELGLTGEANAVREAVIRAHQTSTPRAPVVDTYWTEERVALLKKLHADTLSTQDIAVELGNGITRSAVGAKLRRLGLRDSRARVDRPPRAERTKVRSNLPPRLRTVRRDVDPMFESDGVDGAPAPADLEIPVEQRRTLLQLTDKICHWPVGQPGSGDFFFCGGPAYNGLPYCIHHARRAYTPAAIRRTDRRVA